MYVVLIYDIAAEDGGAKITRKVFTSCKKYLSHVQKSVFEGELTSAQLFKLKTTLQACLRAERDSVIIFKGRSERWMEKEFWTKPIDNTGNII